MIRILIIGTVSFIILAGCQPKDADNSAVGEAEKKEEHIDNTLQQEEFEYAENFSNEIEKSSKIQEGIEGYMNEANSKPFIYESEEWFSEVDIILAAETIRIMEYKDLVGDPPDTLKEHHELIVESFELKLEGNKKAFEGMRNNDSEQIAEASEMINASTEKMKEASSVMDALISEKKNN